MQHMSFDSANTTNLKQIVMSKISTKELHEMKELFWKNNKHNALGEIRLPLFFNELIKRL